MGIHDRDYTRGEVRLAMPSLTPVIKWLLIANAGVFLVDHLLLGNRELSAYGAFRVGTALQSGWIWQLLTFQFLHADFGHLLFNSLGLFFFGPIAERWWGSRRFLAFYLVCGVAGALFFALLWGIGLLPAAGAMTPLVGASAGIFGIFTAVFVINPQQRVQLLIPPVSMTMRQMALLFAGFSIVTILVGWVRPGFFGNEGGEAGHLGGFLMGLLLMRVPGLLRWPWGGNAKIVRPKEFRGRRKRTKPARPASRGEPKIRPRSVIDTGASNEVDRILDKVNEHGVGSLTDQERRILEEVSKGGGKGRK